MNCGSGGGAFVPPWLGSTVGGEERVRAVPRQGTDEAGPGQTSAPTQGFPSTLGRDLDREASPIDSLSASSEGGPSHPREGSPRPSPGRDVKRPRE